MPTRERTLLRLELFEDVTLPVDKVVTLPLKMVGIPQGWNSPMEFDACEELLERTGLEVLETTIQNLTRPSCA